MRRIILIALRVALVASGSVAPAVARDDVQSKANFYAQTSDGECGLEFTITYRNGAVSDVFDAILSKKKLAIGFYDGTILPIDLIGLDAKPFITCVGQRLRPNER